MKEKILMLSTGKSTGDIVRIKLVELIWQEAAAELRALVTED